MSTIPSLSSLPSNPKVISPTTLAHVVLQTPQLEKMRHFYTTFLGGHVVHSAPFLVFITYDEEHHRIALLSQPHITAKAPSTAGLHHIAFTFPNLSALLTAYMQRKKHGIEPAWCVNHGPTSSIYYKDPDGNSIETQVDNFERVEDATEYMKGPAFEKNPIGVAFVPEEWIERLRNGESEEALMQRDDKDLERTLLEGDVIV
ncbi:Glyoxalase/Bleomycin resistance protein/Dihydroxybiphenyl dioxygenase [Trematosphaeria pertusa]|uniref:Glyoxalase/Bleomycin resistance protein/Dihydroxybiphenyl dioxygenase n=1 Tax=Trematosphaeria pertusa TaxID=390896 RepID=A0A6A6HW14_9PLEO|nr:Glyoxalase/Bleomycin resistance protein/Dihydroxybiphenyl dioxygenase [Trematosphaeria pertusa]KAF2242266.1 Glyoxalase/Bleomycin resistance protein/Dihydroxybiphenyl dioxygenase [Trematosphaeria pertusa]